MMSGWFGVAAYQEDQVCISTNKKENYANPLHEASLLLTHKTQNSLYQAQRLAANTTRDDRCVQSFFSAICTALIVIFYPD